jgi:hypothetical protein
MLGGGDVEGDYDGNGTVGPEDYGAWRSSFGTSNALADGNNNGTVDAADYVIWRRAFDASGSGSQFATVPEPGSAALFAMAAAMIAIALRRPMSRYKRRVIGRRVDPA